LKLQSIGVADVNADSLLAGRLSRRKEGAMLNVTRIFYWTTTALIALETFVGGFVDLTHGRTDLVSGAFAADVVTGLGYPLYVLWIIGIWKILGAITLIVPGFLRLKEWAYAGIVFELSGAVASLAACGRTADLTAPLFLLVLALASWALRPPSRTLGKPLIAKD
jgi:hypothetical protein